MKDNIAELPISQFPQSSQILDWLYIWGAVWLFVIRSYTMSKSLDNALVMGKQSVTFQWRFGDLSVTFW